MNKRSEICNLIDMEKPHVLALTEFGAANTIKGGELGISNYTLYQGDHSSGSGGPGRGVALYVHNSLNHSACPKLEAETFDCAAWSAIKLSNNKRLLIVVVYRSPNSQDENNEHLLEILKKAAEVRYEYLMICGDFKLPLVDWDSNLCLDSDHSFTAEFIATVENLNWFQHVQNSTQFRGEQRSCLDLIFTNEKDMVDEVSELPPLGKSDHVCQIFSMVVSEITFKNTTMERYNFKRADWNGIKKDLSSYWVDQNDPPSIMNQKFIDLISESKKRYIPLCKQSKAKHRLPWMKCPKLKKQRVRKWHSWKKFKETGLPRDYDGYKIERNPLKDLARSAK